MASEDNDLHQDSTKTKIVVVVIAAIVLAALLFWYLKPDNQADALPANIASEAVPVTPEPSYQAPEPQPVYEAPEPTVTAEPLPQLNESDANVLAGLQGLSAQTLQYAVPDEILRKFVRAINALQEGKVVHEYRPIVSPPPSFAVEDLDDAAANPPKQYRLTAENYRRYDSYVTLFATLDADQVVALYQRFYPLLEEAYAEMGLKKGNFHSVFIGAIDNLLAAPIVEGEIVLVRPKVFYEYADPALEKSSAAHKLLLRMGPENARSFQESLRKLRVKLTQ
jgi:hypothetical protein